MRRRVQGTEHEYTLFSSKLHDRGIDPHVLALASLHQSNLHSAGEFLVNGSRAYLDVGHMELSTCETSNPYDLLKYEKAGEKIVDWARKTVEEKYLGEGQRIWAYKNNTSPDGTSYGSHENYLVKREVDFPKRFQDEIVPHLVSRMIFSGAGDILEGKYVLSPSAYLTSMVISGNTMHGTGVLNTRDEPHGDGSRFRRLHLLIGDALMNENGILLRHFTTTAILQLMEDNLLKGVPVLEDPVRDMWKNIEQTNPDKWSFELKGGKKITPMGIQRFYLEKVECIVKDDGEKKALKMWDNVLGLIENRKTKDAARKVEWLDRYLAIKEYSDKDALKDPDVEMTACKRYSELSEGRSLYHERVRAGLIDRIITDKDIAKAITAPPQDTRAALRARIADDFEVESMDWSRVTIKDKGYSREIVLNDPLENERGEL